MFDEKYKFTCVDRFLEYVKYDTQSDDNAACFPTTEKQKILSKRLAEDLKGMGLADAHMDENGYVMATLPGNSGKDVPAIGFIAHVDTSPAVSGENVVALIHKNYQGGDIVLPKDGQVIKAEDNPDLANSGRIGLQRQAKGCSRANFLRAGESDLLAAGFSGGSIKAERSKESGMNRMTKLTGGLVLIVGAAMTMSAGAQVSGASGTSATNSAANTQAVRVTVDPRRETLARMLKPVQVEFREQRLEDVMKFFGEVTGADIEVLWTDEQNTTGLDKETVINLKSNGASALKLMERVLEKAQGGTTQGENSWQLTDSGSFQVGPKVRLNAYKRLEIYDIADLIVDVPRYANTPQFDLSQVLSSSSQGGGGGGQSPFQNQNQTQGTNFGDRTQKTTDLITLIQELVEPEQWVDNGGTGGTIRTFQSALIVNAPDYMHRALNGYSFWPSSHQQVSQSKGRRYVSFSGSLQTNTIDGFAEHEVSAVVGGKIISSGGGGR